MCSQIQIVHKKIDLSNVTSKCGSKANIRHKPGSCPLHRLVMLLRSLGVKLVGAEFFLWTSLLLRWWQRGDQKREAGVQSSVQGRLSGQHHPRSWRWREKGSLLAAVLQMTPDLMVLFEKLCSSLSFQHERQQQHRLFSSSYFVRVCFL